MEVNVKTSFLESNVCQHKSKSWRTQEVPTTWPTGSWGRLAAWRAHGVVSPRTVNSLRGEQVFILTVYPAAWLDSLTSSNSFGGTLRILYSMLSGNKFYFFLSNMDVCFFPVWLLCLGLPGKQVWVQCFRKKGQANWVTPYLCVPVFSHWFFLQGGPKQAVHQTDFQIKQYFHPRESTCKNNLEIVIIYHKGRAVL